MKSTTKVFIRGAAACALICLATSFSQAATIIKLNLGSVGPDVGMNGAGIFSTTNDGVAATTGDQNTDIEYTGPFEFKPDLNTNTASFSLQGLAEVGPANVFGNLVIQNYLGGQFSLYDPANVLLLQGPLTSSALSGVIGPGSGGTGALFTTTLGSVTGGTLAPLITPGTVSLSMNLTNVNGGNGFAVAGGGPQLNPFLADASISISADVPEPATFSLVGLGAAAGIAVLARRRR